MNKPFAVRAEILRELMKDEENAEKKGYKFAEIYV